jgi:ribonuclease D
VRVLGYPRDGLDGLLKEKFNVQVNKKYQKADWGKRPLSAEQINYARLDTHYLHPLKEMLEAELEQKGLLQLAREDFERASDVEIPTANRCCGNAWPTITVLPPGVDHLKGVVRSARTDRRKA